MKDTFRIHNSKFEEKLKKHVFLKISNPEK